MVARNLQELFIHELKDLYDANLKTEKFHKLLRDEAKNAELKSTLEDAVSGIKRGIEAIEGICRDHGEKPEGATCKGMRGLIDEAEAHVFEESYADPDVKDAVIIAQAQRMGHYALAGYGTAAAFAHALAHDKSETTLREHLDHIYSGDRRLTRLAENTVNKSALS